MTENNYLTVTALTKYLKRKFTADPYLKKVWLVGEISNFRLRPKHQYFSLKDENAVIDVVMFASDFSKVKFRPEEGMKVIVSGRVDVYEGSGKYQFYVETMEPEGIGALYQALKELQQKTNEINAWLKTRQWSEEPISVAAGYELLGIRVEQTIKSARELLARIDSDSTKAGKIRSGTFIQGGMMDFSDISGAEKGQPQYRIRSRRAFRQVRESYNSAAGRLSERHKNDANFKPLSW